MTKKQEYNNDRAVFELPMPQSHTPVNLSDLALPQDFQHLAEVSTEVLAVPLKRPGKQTWFSPHPESALWMSAAIIQDEAEGDAFVVASGLRGELTGEWVPKILVPCLTRQGSWMVWPIRFPGPDGKIDTWNQSALEIAKKYGGKWIRVVSNREIGAYEAASPISPLDPPAWPEDINPILQTALKGNVIDNRDHPLLKRLRGEL